MQKAIYFDMDGTIAATYSVTHWLEDLEAQYTRPYREALPLVNMRTLGRVLNQLQRNGYHIGIVSWLSRSGSTEYHARIDRTKRDWLQRHLGSVEWDEIRIIPHGSPKHDAVQYPGGILFDDEERNRKSWTGTAYDVDNILNILAALL